MIPECRKCFGKCHAECCTWVDLNIEWVKKHQDKIQRSVYGYIDTYPGQGKFITNMDKDPEGKIYNDRQICPFLSKDFKCAVYKERPLICRLFGTDTREDHPFTCHYHIGKSYHFPVSRTSEECIANMMKYLSEIQTKHPNIIKEL